MIAHKKFLGSFLIVACLLAGSVSAVTMLAMTLEEKVKASDLGIQGRVLDASSRWGDKDRSVIYTDYVIEIEDVLHGKAGGKTVVVTQQGGALAGVILQVGSNPEIVKGDRVILILAKADFLKGMARGDDRPKYTIVGVAQGTYYVVKGEKGNTAFRDYARLAIVPRPDLEPSKRSRVEALKAEIEILRREYKRNPEDRSLARRLAQAEALMKSAPETPKRKPVSDKKLPTDKEKILDLGGKPPAPPATPKEEAEELRDAPSDVADREQALKKALELHASRFKRIVAPIPLDELKKSIREISRRIQ